jgi:choline dehydrogenase-like flavoprotein
VKNVNSTDDGPALAREERWLKLALIAGTILFAVEAVLYVPDVFSGTASARPYAINSVAKDVVLTLLAAGAAADVVRRARLIGLIIAAHVVIVTLLALDLIVGDTAFAFPPPQWLSKLLPFTDIPTGDRTLVWLIGAAVALAALVVLQREALKARYDLRYLWPTEHATVAATADAIIADPVMTPEETASRVDRYWDAIDIGYKIRLRLALWVIFLLPLLFGRPPLPYMSRPARKRFITRRFQHDVAARKDLGFLRMTVQSTFRFVMLLLYVGYYDDRRTDAVTGYTPFSRRPNFPGPPPEPPALAMKTLKRGTDRLDADVVIVGSGAGGSIVARALAQRGRSVLMLERGRHFSPKDFTEDESSQFAHLYSDGALQTSREFTFQVLQGMCVGGSTVVNNGICFDLPADVLANWNGPSLDAGLPPQALAASFAEVRTLIRAQSQAAVRANPVTARLPGVPLQAVSANLHDCLGCGYCNLGCAYNRKLSMLVTLLPRTQADFPGQLEILPQCEAVTIDHRDRHATGVTAQLRGEGNRKLKITARTVVVAAGAIHSSRLLMSSRIGGTLVGRGLAANVGSHMTALWPENGAIDAFDGLQMSHYLRDDAAGYKIETWFNPVMSQAIVMPGWLDDHQNNMNRYNRLACLGVIAGSTRDDNNRVLRNRTFVGSEIAFTPSEHDLGVLLTGLREAGKLLLDAGAECVMPATFAYHELRTEAELQRLKVGGLVQDASDISVNTGHPQGGNPIGRQPRTGVVDETLRVHGYDNLFVCDASVFPTAITVNPQLTVMALAHYAATNHIA